MTIKPKAVGAPTSEPKMIEGPRQFDKTVEALKHDAATATSALSGNLEQAQTKVKQGVDRAMKTAEQLTHFHQGNMEAMVKASQIWAAGLQDLSKHVASNARTAMEETMSTMKAMSTVKSLKEAFELQSSFAKSSLEKAMSEGTKLTETSLKLAEEAYAPLTARVNAAVEVFSPRA